MKRFLLIFVTILVFSSSASAGHYRVYTSTGAIAIAATLTAYDSVNVKQIVIHFSLAPTTSENLLIKLDSNAGAAYDTMLYTVDPSDSSITDLVWIPDDGAFAMVYGDEIDITYANTDTRTIGISVYYELVP
jgi:hypothetical protein